MKTVIKKLSEKEWELIEMLRNFRNAKHNPSIEINLYLDYLFESLKENDPED